MADDTQHWTYSEFHAFTMLYAANVDGQISLEEENLIIPILSTKDYERIKAIFQRCHDADALEIIMFYKDKYCKSQADKDRILADMMAIYQSNAAYDQIERGVHQMFQRMI